MPAPRFTVISAVYNVGRYLGEFIDSLEKQTFGVADIEIIAVDDGSTDDSAAILQAWAARRPGSVRVISKPNGGQSSARNLGLEHATGQWVTFTDPDDILDEKYFAVVDAFLREHPETEMVATARIFYSEATKSIVDDHPLRRMFGTDQLVDLDEHPDYFHGSAPAAFFKTAVINAAGLRFDERVRPNFEDGHFCTRYLLLTDRPLVGFLGSARYIYRKRADGSSTLQGGQRTANRFVDVPRYGYLDLLERSDGGRAPAWVQNLIIYELSYYFAAELEISGTTAAHGAVATEFVSLLRQIAAHLDPELVASFAVARFDSAWRDVLLHGLDGAPWVSPYAVTDRVDGDLVRVSYRFVGPAPSEQLLVDGRPAEVRYGKVWVHEYFERDLLNERVAWIPRGGTLTVRLNDTAVDVLDAWPGPQIPQRVRTIRASTKVVRWLAGTALVRRRYRDAWCLMDRIHNADDNAERLFRYLRSERPDINAWFVLQKGTPDWQRLRREGYRRRLIAHGGIRWRLAMLNCTQLVSSHIDPPTHRPAEILRMNPEPSWRFSFLQHGVIKDDLSRWLNPKDVDLFVTSTPQEQESVAGDGTHYCYTAKEARMTGLPRFDRLREIRAEVADADRTRVLVCPTWRYWLTPPIVGSSQRRRVLDDFTEVRVRAELAGPARRSAAARARDRARTADRLPAAPEPAAGAAQPHAARPCRGTYLRGQRRAAVDRGVGVLMVTDYSSMSFNAAYLDEPVVYFQFDAERVAGGAHVGQPGYLRLRTWDELRPSHVDDRSDRGRRGGDRLLARPAPRAGVPAAHRCHIHRARRALLRADHRRDRSARSVGRRLATRGGVRVVGSRRAAHGTGRSAALPLPDRSVPRQRSSQAVRPIDAGVRMKINISRSPEREGELTMSRFQMTLTVAASRWR